MSTELIMVGFGNVLAVNRVVAIMVPNSAPTKRLIQEGKQKGITVDLTSGRRTKAVLIMDSGHVVLAAITPETITSRARKLGGLVTMDDGPTTDTEND